MMILSFILFSIPFTSSLILYIKLKSYYIYSISILLYVISLFALVKGGCTDPGIIPRQMGNPEAIFRKKREYNIVSNGSFVKFSYCYTCNIFRPPRTSHCAQCDNCCQRFDHHCMWLGNCIGKRNYKYFFLLVLTLIINAFIEIIYNIVVVVQSFIDKEEKKIKLRLVTIAVLSLVAFVDLMFIIFFLGPLQFTHLNLLINNITFYEKVKKKLVNPAEINPFYKNIYQHIYRLIIKFSPKSLLNGNRRIQSKYNGEININKEYVIHNNKFDIK